MPRPPYKIVRQSIRTPEEEKKKRHPALTVAKYATAPLVFRYTRAGRKAANRARFNMLKKDINTVHQAGVKAHYNLRKAAFESSYGGHPIDRLGRRSQKAAHAVKFHTRKNAKSIRRDIISRGTSAKTKTIHFGNAASRGWHNQSYMPKGNPHASIFNLGVRASLGTRNRRIATGAVLATAAAGAGAYAYHRHRKRKQLENNMRKGRIR